MAQTVKASSAAIGGATSVARPLNIGSFIEVNPLGEIGCPRAGIGHVEGWVRCVLGLDETPRIQILRSGVSLLHVLNGHLLRETSV